MLDGIEETLDEIALKAGDETVGVISLVAEKGLGPDLGRQWFRLGNVVSVPIGEAERQWIAKGVDDHSNAKSVCGCSSSRRSAPANRATERLNGISRSGSHKLDKLSHSLDPPQRINLTRNDASVILGKIAMRTRWKSLSEVEFERLLDAVRTAVAPAPEEDFLTYLSTFNQPAKAANDNQLGLSLIPFPEGWYAF